MKHRQILLGVLLSVVLPGFSGARTVLQNKGSDTLVNVAQAWAEEYQNVNPDVAVAVSGGGSGTGIAAFINGTVDIANSSRKMEAPEIEEAKAHGKTPVEHIVGYDALAVYLHQNNPATQLTIAQLQQIYARELDGHKNMTKKWTDAGIGITVPGCQKQQLVLVGRQNNSGTYQYFREAVLGKKSKYKLGSLDMNGSKDVVDLVEKTPCAIGYSGIAYATKTVKVACIAKTAETPCIHPTLETTLDGSYPIARPLFMYTNGEATGPIKEYLDWILSDAGQCIITKIGYAPVRRINCPKE
jgi:phosphate transport system substrate-binding protein